MESFKPKRHVKKRTGTVRRRTGCLTCRMRRKKCDEAYPICGHCIRLNLKCEREKPRALDEGYKSSEEGSSPDIAIPTRNGANAMMIPKAPHPMDIGSVVESRQFGSKRFLMKYYVQILTNLLTTSVENNYFLSIFVPMSVDSEPVLAALMAWSSMHLSRFDSSYSVPALEHRSTALNAVASALVPQTNAPPVDAEATLASALILCSMEVIMGDNSRWYDHLLGARNIIQSARSTSPTGKTVFGAEHFLQTIDGQWLLADFAYHDVLGSVALGKPPLIRGAYWLKGEATIVDSYAGVGSRILGLISEISCLPERAQNEIEGTYLQVPPTLSFSDSDMSSTSSQSDTCSPEPFVEPDFPSRARTIEKALREWEPPDSVNDVLRELGRAYRASALIYLYRKVRAFAPIMTKVVDAKIRCNVDEIVDHLRNIPITSYPECAIPFPLFMAGGDTMDPDHTEYIQERLKSLLKHRGFANTQSILDVLEELWRLKSASQTGPTGGPVDWMDIVRAKNWKLSLA